MKVLVGVLVVALWFSILVLAVRGRRPEQRREREHLERIRQWTAGRSWTVTERPAVDWAARLPGQMRHSVSLLVSGVVSGRPVGVAECSYMGVGSTLPPMPPPTYNYIVTVVRLDVSYPPLAVLRRGARSRLGRRVFGDNAAATGHDAFDRRFRVDTEDPALTRTLLGPALIAEHLAGRVPAWSLAGLDLLTWQGGRIEDPDQIATLAAPRARVAELLGR